MAPVAVCGNPSNGGRAGQGPPSPQFAKVQAEQTPTDQAELQPWEVTRYALDQPIKQLNDIHFAGIRLHLLPHNRADFAEIDCSCPDYANPCEHIAGVYYRLASRFDSDPFLLCELRGLWRERLHQSLSATPLGQALAPLMDERDEPPQPAESFFTRPGPATEIEPASPAAVPGILVRKAGDFPGFWNKSGSLVELMEALYGRVREKNQGAL